MSIKETLENSFEIYAGMTIADRAICDARDMLKPSARASIYAQYLEGITPDKPHKKAQKSVAAALDHFYTHGDMSLYPMLARMGKPFAMRYVLEDFQGNTGTIVYSNDEAASRYTEMRLAPLSMYFFKDIEKNTIDRWYDNYNGDEKYPAALPSKGFYNIVNGTRGIATGISSSIPQFNLREVNNALITLLNNPNATDDEILCMPDFTGGGILLNKDEVRESLLKGEGAACKLRAVVEYDSKNNRLIVTETPYGVYTSTIMGQLRDIALSDDNPGIERPLDCSKTKANIEIELCKKANVDKVIRYLYKNTSIQYHYPINLLMLDNGKIPKVFTWREALQAHLNHEKIVYRKAFEFDLKKLNDRKHILDGYIICLADIEEVVKVIKDSVSTTAAKTNLIANFKLDDTQASAVLKLTLSRLAHLEVQKIEQELKEIIAEIGKIEKILGSEELLNKEIEKGLREVAEKFGDARRTKIMNLSSTDDEPVEKKQLQISYTNKDNLIAIESSTLYTQRRGGVGNKLKLDKDEYVTTSIITDNTGDLLFFTEAGDVFNCKASSIELNQKTYISNYISLGDHDKICALAPNDKSHKYLIFITKDGMMKKSEIGEYASKRSGSLRALTLGKDDRIVAVLQCNDENIGIATKAGNFIIVETNDVRATGRVTAGIHGMKLNANDEVIAAHLIPKETKEIVSISQSGLFKKTAYNEFGIQNKNTKGSKIQKFNGNDCLADFIPISQKVDLIIGSTLSTIKLTSDDVPSSSKSTVGIKSIKLNEVGRVLKILISN